MAIPYNPSALEMKVSNIIAGLCLRGVAFDTQKATALQAQWTDDATLTETYFRQRFPTSIIRAAAPRYGVSVQDGAVYTTIAYHPFNPMSNADCADQFVQLGWQPQSWTETGQVEMTDDVMATIPLAEAVKLATYRKIKKKLSMLDGYIKVVDCDRVYHTINPLGTRTGRMTHASPNLGQVPKADDLRSLFIASPGMVLVGVDADAIEARCLAAALAKYDNGALINILEHGSKGAGTDFHSLNQRAMNFHHRDFAKTFLYACVYGAGYAKLGMTVAEDAIAAGLSFMVSFEQAGKQAKSRLMKSIIGYKAMVDDMIAQWKADGYVALCDGRRLNPKGNHVVLNTLLQGNGAIAMKLALVLFDDWVRRERVPCWPVLNVHDEMVVETHPDIAEEVKRHLIESIEEAGRQLNISCPLRANGAVGKTWKETK